MAVMVRIGELALAGPGEDGEELVALGLGSCIAVALVEPGRGRAALAHVMLPASEGRGDGPPGKYADLAVPALLDGLAGLGARRTALLAVLAGGASMFTGAGSGLDIGARNDAAVRAALALARVRVAAADTGGGTGRTLRVHVARGRVSVRPTGSPERELLAPRAVGVAA